MTLTTAETTAPTKNTGKVHLYDLSEFEGMRRAGQLTAAALDEVGKIIEPGLPTSAIDKLVFEFGVWLNADSGVSIQRFL